MSTPYVAEIRSFGFNFAPQGWAICDGSLLPISQYDVLFNLIGTIYGGDGVNNFALPNLMGNVALHQGESQGTSNRVIGESGGQANVTLSITDTPSHSHSVSAGIGISSSRIPTSNFPNTSAREVYGTSAGATALASEVSNNGGGQPHNNMQPSLAITYAISLFGVFPSQS